MAEEKQASMKIDSRTDTLEVAQMQQYQGKTLTVGQKQALDSYNKKVAEMKNENGDRKKDKRESSHDKFKDEDVVKYMYEDWFLGGLSWLCNKIEDKTLAIIDAAGNAWQDRRNHRKAEKDTFKDERTKETAEKLLSFDDMTLKDEKKVNNLFEGKKESYDNLFEELKNNYDKPARQQQWKFFSPTDPVIQTIMSDQNLPQFLERGSEEIQNRVKMITAIDKLAIRYANIEMQDEVLRNDKAWRNKEGTYKSNEELRETFQTRRNQRYKEIFEASQELREKYPNDMEKQNGLINAFIKNLSDELGKTKEIQEKQISEHQFDSIGKGPNKDVSKKLSSLIDNAKKFVGNAGNNTRSNTSQDLRGAVNSTTEETNLQDRKKNLNNDEQRLKARHNSNEERKRNFKDHVNKIFHKENTGNTHNTSLSRNTGGRE